MRGRKPIPSKIHQLRGNPGKRQLPDTLEDKFPAGVPEPPEILNEAALAEWNRIVPQLQEVGILKRVDRTALAGYCLTYARWLEAERALITGGSFIRSPTNGSVHISPWFRMIEKCLDQMKSFMADFGMTPAARVRIRPGSSGKEEDPFEAWLSGSDKKTG